MIAQVGTISANHDETIGRIIAEAMDKVGKDGVITVEEARSMDTSLDVVEGMQFDRGYLSPYFVTDPERMEVVLENPVILIHEKRISALKGRRASRTRSMQPRRLSERGSSPVAVSLCFGRKALENLVVIGDEQIGVKIITRAIEEPMRWIAANAGQEGSIVVQRVREMKDDEGFNAQTERYENLVAAGVIDPTKVVRSALQNAASIASLLLTTEAVISLLPEKYQDEAAAASSMGGGMY